MAINISKIVRMFSGVMIFILTSTVLLSFSNDVSKAEQPVSRDQSGFVDGVADVRSPAFGAKGDGRADDTVAIQAAIDRYARVYLPAGVYRINSKVGLSLRTGTQLLETGAQRLCSSQCQAVEPLRIWRHTERDL
ncbi:hypothetical protein JW805_20980 [Roseomonas aeriglobus]|nr:hypothetical protein [Roseomonas aeriglobus]